MGSAKFTARLSRMLDLIDQKRKAQDLSWEELGDKLGMSRDTVYKRRRNPGGFKLWELLKLIDDMEISEEEMLRVLVATNEKRLRLTSYNGNSITVTVGPSFTDKMPEVLEAELKKHGGKFSSFGNVGDKIEVLP